MSVGGSGSGFGQTQDLNLQGVQQRAEQGDAVAEAFLGWMYRQGKGVEQGDAEALKWYRLAAEQGFAEAQHELGQMYGAGQGVPKDHAEALKWYRVGADSSRRALGVRWAADLWLVGQKLRPS